MDKKYSITEEKIRDMDITFLDLDDVNDKLSDKDLLEGIFSNYGKFFHKLVASRKNPLILINDLINRERQLKCLQRFGLVCYCDTIGMFKLNENGKKILVDSIESMKNYMEKWGHLGKDLPNGQK